MKELYLWEIEYEVTGLYSPIREVSIITDKNSYAEAERVAILVSNEEWKDNANVDFSHIKNIRPSRKVYTQTPQT